MGLWERIKSGAKTIIKKVVTVVKGAIKKYVKPTVNKVREWGRDVSDSRVGRAYETGKRAVDSVMNAAETEVRRWTREAAASIARQFQHETQRWQSALGKAQRGEPLYFLDIVGLTGKQRRDLNRIKASLKGAAQQTISDVISTERERQARILKRSADIVRAQKKVRDQIKKMDVAVKKAVAARKVRLENDLIQLQTKSRERREAWENDHADAIQALQGRKKQAQALYDRAVGQWDKIREAEEAFGDPQREAAIRAGLVIRDLAAVDLGTKDRPMRVVFPGSGIAGVVKKGGAKIGVRELVDKISKMKLSEVERLLGTRLRTDVGRRFRPDEVKEHVTNMILTGKIPVKTYERLGLGINVAEKRIAEVLSKAKAENLLKALENNPARVLKAISEIKGKDKNKFFATLETPGLGKIEKNALERAAGNEIVKKLENPAGWRALPSGWRKAISYAVVGTGLLNMLQYLNQETRGTGGIGIYTLISQKNWEAAEQSIDKYEKLVDSTAKIDKYLRLGNVFRSAYDTNLEGFRQQIVDYREAVRFGIENEPYSFKTYMKLKANAPDTNFRVLGSSYKYKPNKRYEFGANRSYYVRAEAPGYQAQTWKFFGKPGETYKKDFNLKKGKSRLGTVILKSTPDAEILLGGEDTGRQTPDTFSLDAGVYDFTLTAWGYEPVTRTINLFAGGTMTIDVALQSIEEERLTTKAYVTITTEPWGARVFIDGFMMNYPTPTKLDLDPGTHKIEIEKEGFRKVVDSITVEAGTQYRRNYNLEEKAAPAPAPEAPEEETKVWRVWVNSDPDGAKIYVDDEFTGFYTDGFVDLLPGTYNVCVERSGFQRACREVVVGPGGEGELLEDEQVEEPGEEVPVLGPFAPGAG